MGQQQRSSSLLTPAMAHSDRLNSRFEKMEASAKSSVCKHKAKGVQGVRAKFAERGHRHRAAEGRRDVSGWLAQQRTRGSHARSKRSCTQGRGSMSLHKFKLDIEGRPRPMAGCTRTACKELRSSMHAKAHSSSPRPRRCPTSTHLRRWMSPSTLVRYLR